MVVEPKVAKWLVVVVRETTRSLSGPRQSRVWTPVQAVGCAFAMLIA